MKAYFRWYGHVYEVINPSTKCAQYYCEVFAKHWPAKAVSLYYCYDKPSYRKKHVYTDLVDMCSYTTVTSYNYRRFTTMSIIEGLTALFVDTGVNSYVVADRADLKRFANELGTAHCEYREEK